MVLEWMSWQSRNLKTGNYRNKLLLNNINQNYMKSFRLPKVTDKIPRNADKTYTCPKCKEGFDGRGFTHHVKSCDPQWYRENIKKG